MKEKIKKLPAACFLLLLFLMLNKNGKAFHYFPFQIAATLFVLNFVVLPAVEKFAVPKQMIAVLSALIPIAFCLWLAFGWNIAASTAISMVGVLITVSLRMHGETGVAYHFKKLFKLTGLK